MANLSPLVFYPRFAHVTEQIFEQLDQKSLSNCKEVSKSWKEIIDHKNLPWIQIVNVPKIVENGETYLHHAAKTGQSEMFVKILEGETVKNPKNNSKATPFHHVCFHGHLKIAKMLVHRHRCKRGGPRGSDPPLRPKIWLDPPPWKIFEQVTP